MNARPLGWLITSMGLGAGAVLWEIAGRTVGAAFVAPLSETLPVAASPAVWRALGSSLALFPLDRARVVARRPAALRAPVCAHGHPAGDRPRSRRHGGGGVLPERKRDRDDAAERGAELRHRDGIRGDPPGDALGRGADGARRSDRAPIRRLAEHPHMTAESRLAGE